MNKKKGDQMQFFLEKKTRKKKMDSSNTSYQLMDCVTKAIDNGVIDSTILLETFSFV